MQPRVVRRFQGLVSHRDGERIDPLTISDAYSRYLLRCQAVEKTDTERVQAIFEAAFREYGMPEAIRTDNGRRSFARCGRTIAAGVWWIKLGIVPERIAQGIRSRTEDMRHASDVETGSGTAAGGQPPPAATGVASLSPGIQPSASSRSPGNANASRCVSAVSEKLSVAGAGTGIPATMLVRSVRWQGIFRWKKHDVFLTEVLWGENVGLLPEDDAGSRSTSHNILWHVLTAKNCV